VSRRQDILATVTPIGVKFCMMEHIGPGIFFSSFGSGTNKGSQNPKFGLNVAINREYLENGKSQRYMSIRA